ncbi:MAG TPA: 2-phospho-L-lactate guanylyltransferase [Dehalococcoidia bacterium]|jgi:2-phospho-L-lactate guanylyltransferase|nr:2-phospho-L-lactate guanylyltransferase [Dehalococcoidia bacterium]
MRWALIPVKDLRSAKERLGSALSERDRERLALAMLRDVIATAAQVVDGVAVVSRDSEALWTAREAGATPLLEPGNVAGLNGALEHAARSLMRRRSCDTLLIVHADVPLIRAYDLRGALDALAGDRCVVAVRSHDGGTNALVLRPPDAIRLRFGPRSFDAHAEEAEAAGVRFVALHNDRIAFDVDRPEDLMALLARRPGGATGELLSGLLPASA